MCNLGGCIFVLVSIIITLSYEFEWTFPFFLRTWGLITSKLWFIIFQTVILERYLNQIVFNRECICRVNWNLNRFMINLDQWPIFWMVIFKFNISILWDFENSMLSWNRGIKYLNIIVTTAPNTYWEIRDFN